MSDRRAKDAVFLVQVPVDFHPQRPWDLPDRADSIEVYVKNIAITHALGFCRTFNLRQMKLGLPDRLWAIPVKHTRFHFDRADAAAPVSRSATPIAESPAPEEPKTVAGFGGAP